LECGDRSRRFALPRPQSRQLRLPQSKAATAVAALQNYEPSTRESSYAGVTSN